MNWLTQLETDGFALLTGVLSAKVVDSALAEWAEVTRRYASDESLLTGEGGPAYGARNLLDIWPRVMELARARETSSGSRD
ncbi:MAG: hypothetical protein L0241_15635 [Planctomycetia bacterium]|nr:hypothetical protein [Planctomycetia bacterium]